MLLQHLCRAGVIIKEINICSDGYIHVQQNFISAQQCCIKGKILLIITSIYFVVFIQNVQFILIHIEQFLYT